MQLLVLAAIALSVLINALLWRKVMATLDDIVADVASETTVDASIVTLLTNIAAQLKAAGQDQAKLDALHSAIQGNITTIQSSVTANTPAAP